MSLENYNKALKIIENNKKMCHFAGPRSEKLLTFAEETLGIEFSPLYRDFLKRFGAGNFGSQEIYGVIDEDFENSSVPDAIWFTLTEREEGGFPSNLLVIYDNGEELFCLDNNKRNLYNEPAIVSYIPGQDLHLQLFETIAEDFGDFLLDLVN